MSPTDLRQVSKFSLGRYLKLFPWHPKDLVGRKNILAESKIFSFNSICIFLASFKMNGFHGKWHNSVIMCPTDLRQGSKFSLIQYLKLIPWHPKDLVSRKKGFRRAEKVDINCDPPFMMVSWKSSIYLQKLGWNLRYSTTRLAPKDSYYNISSVYIKNWKDIEAPLKTGWQI